jgi:acyl transferase domain-containing protein
MKQVYGSKTGVYTGSMSDDYQQILARDIDDLPKYTASGVARAMLANRLSWFYNLHGPSISMDSACSGSLMAFDFACQNLRNRDCDMVNSIRCH